MSQKPLRFRVPDIRFRVLIVGRANAGKTSILQRVCETTESPKIYRINHGRREEIRLDPTAERGDHDIEDELVFTNHDGYVFHDSCGFEAGSEAELQIVQNFVRKKATAPRLRDRLHAVWYCIPMENARPMLDMKFFGAICPDKNVPVIAVFTKYDQFKRDIKIKVAMRSGGNLTAKDADGEVEKIFQEQYWDVVKDESPRYVRLEKMHKVGERCDALITETSNALSTNVATLMLLAVQRGNLEISVRMAMERTSLDGNGLSKVKSCTKYFPHLWVLGKEDDWWEDDDDWWEEELDEDWEWWWLDEDRRMKHTVDQISSILGKDGLDILDNCHPAHHTLLVSAVLLECATVLFLSADATLDVALQEAFSRLTSSYPALQAQLSSLSQDCTKEDYIAFVLKHKLTISQ